MTVVEYIPVWRDGIILGLMGYTGGYVRAGLDHTERMGITLGLWWGILGKWGSDWDCGYWGE